MGLKKFSKLTLKLIQKFTKTSQKYQIVKYSAML